MSGVSPSPPASLLPNAAAHFNPAPSPRSYPHPPHPHRTISPPSPRPSGRARTISQTSMSSVGSRGSDSDQDGGSGPSRGLRRSVSASSSIMMVKLPFKRKLIKLHSTVVHDAHHDDPAHHAHFYHEHVEVGTFFCRALSCDPSSPSTCCPAVFPTHPNPPPTPNPNPPLPTRCRVRSSFSTFFLWL